MASIAQAEAVNKEDFAKVARVALQPGRTAASSPCDCLQFDSTVNYWLRAQGKPAKASEHMTDAQLDDTNEPVQHRTTSPACPIGADQQPGQGRAEGAIDRRSARLAIYFVAIDKQGTTAFATTYAEHDANVAAGLPERHPVCC